MRLPKFECLEPRTIQEACSMLSKCGDAGKVLAGGTDLLLQMKNRETSPRYLIRLKSIPDLDYIKPDEMGGLRIGALATMSAIENSAIIKEKCDILSRTAHTMASLQIRSSATIGGNLCNALPSADTASPLIVLGAKLKLTNGTTERTVPVEEFFVGPEKTVLRNDELLKEIQVNDLPPHSGAVYIKHTLRRAMEIAVVGVAVMISAGSTKQICEDIKIAFGAVAPTPVRARQAEAIIKGKKVDKKLVDQVAGATMNEIRPISDFRSSAEYRREMVKVLTSRAIMQAWEKAIS